MPSHIVFDGAAAPADPVVQVGGVRYYRAGDTDIAPTHGLNQVQGSASDCDEGLAVPATCPGCGLARYFQLAAGGLGQLAPCATCQNPVASNGPWGGRFGPISAGICRWNLEPAAGVTDTTLGGKALAVGFSWLELNAAQSRWEIIIKCRGGIVSPVVWQGTKTTGRTPAGDYTRIAGCSGPTTLTLEKVPL